MQHLLLFSQARRTLDSVWLLRNLKQKMEFSYRRLLLQNEDVPISTSMPPLPHAKHATNASSPQVSLGSPLEVSIRPVFTSSVAYVFLILFTTFFFIGFVFLYFQQHASSSDSESGAIRRRAQSESVAEKSLAVVADAARQGDCAICLEEVGEGEAVKMIAYCKHVFHADCIDRWLEKQVTCPVCRCCCERCGEVESVTVRGDEGGDGEVVSVRSLD
ncbi:RING-H2 finger protein [Vigna angularis]|uniref:RING-type E3 ubiquitin transferase n=2 Tax=Phaseolus angularis TaxID=3914 RepID=A0A8T0KE72_PHAAN|nr:E3 ubiquitin-protein ligase ATL6 [Vigna angularis]KAG2397509.1 RING-H2 finger protein [Vigna angularis]